MSRPLVALILGIVPFFLFVGSTNVVTVNGVRVRDDSFNVLGLVLAGIGLVITIKALLPKNGGRDAVRQGLAALALAICAFQIAVSGGVVSKRDLMAAVWPDSTLPALEFHGLEDGNRKIADGILAKNEPGQTIRQIIGYKVSAAADANRHVTYAEVCHSGRSRLDMNSIEALPDFLDENARAEISRRVEADRRAPPSPESCNEKQAVYYMGELVDRAKRANAMADMLIQGYPAQIAGN
ncbi:hypothetical protein [Terrihabitans sp. B22-R8]|uniref:hypothetical protein n=1 Tax=Terrihabitans sp. B22-R8 TaxID=3425128 RepID=UPI00403C1034